MNIITRNFKNLYSTIKPQSIFRKLLFFFLLLVGLSASSQESILLQGQVKASANDLEKIHVINMNLEQGSVTNKEGEFEIRARLKDTLYFSSVQFKNRSVIVDAEILKDGKLEVELSEKMNELAEVVIDDIELSGYLANDISKISTKKFERNYKLQSDLGAVIQRDRELNPYDQAGMGGIRIDKLAMAAVNKFSKDKKPRIIYTTEDIVDKGLQTVGYQFFEKQLGLAENEISNFLYFCTEDAPKFRNLVLNDNALVLIEYFESRIDEFKERRGNLLNEKGQIPG